MSDKSFGDYANRNIVKNPLLSTAVTGLSIEDLTHNAVLVPVAPNQGLITGLDQIGTYTQTLAHTDHDITNFPSGDSNSNILLPPQPSISTQSLTLDSQTRHYHDGKAELPSSTVSKASAKSEDDFDVNEYFARLQGTRYVSAPLHSHTDPNANLTETEENLEEINLNDDKTAEVQQSLTADIAQNFSQLPNVLPHVASAVFSSFSNMWNMKSREQTPDDRAQSYQDLQFQRNQELNQQQSSLVSQSYQNVHFEGQHSGLSQFQTQGVEMPSVPLMSTEDVVKEVAPPPKEPPICGTSNFRLPSKKKYAQIPGLSTGESKPMAFNPIKQNVPSYFIPTAVTQEENKDNIAKELISTEIKQQDLKENYNIMTPQNTASTTNASVHQPYVKPAETQPTLVEEPPPTINLQNQIPVIPPPPMFSTTRRDSQSGKSVLPPSVARRIGSNHPVIKQQTVMQPPPVSGQIFVPTFDVGQAPALDPNLPPTNETIPQVPTYNPPMFAPNMSQASTQDTAAVMPSNAPPQMPISSAFGPPAKAGLPPSSQVKIPPLPVSDSATKILSTEKPAPSIYNPSSQSATPAIFTPVIPDTASATSTLFSQGPPSSSIFRPETSISPPQLPPGPPQPIIGTANVGPTLFTPNVANIPPPLSESIPTFGASKTDQQVARPPTQGQPSLFTPQIPNIAPPLKDETQAEPPKPLMEPPKAIGASNFRMTKKRPQYYSGPIEGIGSISNSIKPVIPTVDSGTFQGALFTPEQLQIDSSVSSFDITKQTDTTASYPAYDVTSQPATSDLNKTPYASQGATYPSYDTTQPTQDYGQQYTTAFDLSRPTTDSYEQQEEPKENKGFGIIGSLKSKLSNIDINKIQNSVTTFFDPTYNDSKKDAAVPQENAPYNTQQYQGYSQSNFEIFVPNVEQSQPYNYNYQANQTAYGQVNPGYPVDYNYHSQNTPYAAPNVSYQGYSNSYYSDQTPSFNQQQATNIDTQETVADKTAHEPVKDEMTKASKHAEIKQAESMNPTLAHSEADIAKTVQPVASEVDPKKHESELELQRHIEDKQEETATSLFTEASHISKSTTESIKSIDTTFDNLATALPHQEYKQFKGAVGPPNQSSHQSTTAQKSLFDITSNYAIPSTSQFENNAFKNPSDVIGKEIKTTSSANVLFDDSKKGDVLSSFGTQNVSSFLNAAPDKVREMKPVDLFANPQLNVAKKPEIPKNDLLESLTKGEVPILGVSSVPLFGLSTKVADKTENDEINLPLYEKAKSINMLEKNASMSFFENFGTVAQKPSETYDDIPRQSLSFFENPLLDPVGAHDEQIPSVSFFSNDQKVEQSDTARNVDLVLDRNTSLFENISTTSKPEDFGLEEDLALDREDADSVSELNICETCREFNKPEDREMEREDVTTQLIENITSPIQLSNAVEVPLSEDSNTQRVDFDAGQFEELSHITEETIETLHVQSATELLQDDDIKISNYGWSIDESFVTNPPKHSDFNYTVAPNSISFFGDSLFRDNVPTNASDEIKAEFKHQEDLLPRQMSIPSAPPAEEDSKSDEAGVLDVHSIELDAKKDFPIYEEFVIEPSETDDDKIEYKEREKTEETELDSFTNRVEKFKKMEEVTEVEEPKSMKYFELPSQPISMASYFDTGNYAADTHYRNTMSSPSNISIPPGFEEEFKKRLALAKAREEAKTVPDTQTQTKTTISVSFTTANTFNTVHSIMPVGFDVEDNVSHIVEDQTEKLPHISSIFASISANKPTTSTVEHISNISDTSEELPQASSIFASSSAKILEEPLSFGISKAADDKPEELPQASSIFASGTAKKPGAPPIFASGVPSSVTGSAESSSLTSTDLIETKPDAKNTSFVEEKLPETSNMFTFGVTDKPGPSSLSQNVTAPVDKKPDAPKLPDPINFFTDSSAAPPAENFSRLASYFSSPPKTEHAKSFFELSQSQNHYRHAIDSDKYHDLMKDLTSVQNLAVPADQTIRHVNYFTIEYDSVPPEFSKGDSTKDIPETDDRELDSLSHCMLCSNLINDKTFKVKSTMNNNTEGRDTVPNIENPSGGNRHSMSSILNFEGIQTPEEANEGVAGMTENRSTPEYTPVKHHWFYRVDIDEKSIWRGFSITDSRALETAFLSPELNENTLVATDGGRYDVNVVGRLRIPVYWTDKPTNVRRCSWFYKGTTDPRYVPYTESVADKLEVEYHHGMTTGEWHRRLVLPNGEVVVMHGPNVMVHFINSDGFSSPPLFSFGKRVYRNPPKIRVSRDQPEKIDHLIFMVHGAGEYRIQKEKMDAKQSSSRPRVVRRGHDESEIEDPEPSSIDHLLLLCHGVGSACDMRFRSVEEVVEDFRSTSLQLVQSHYKNSYDQGIVSRVEVLPISWHATLHSGETGVDRRLAQITLDSIPRLRSFTNDTVLDVLFYTSPVFCQTILNTVCKELNRIYKLFIERNPTFKGGVSLGGHSLGSVILYDLLCHQRPEDERRDTHKPEKNYVTGSAGTGQPSVHYPSLQFQPAALYALGSPIAIFECIRGVESLGVDFSLPTCKNFFNIFHPYDPIAYRIEPLINPLLRDLKPYLIPHHKGRKRMHLELKDTMARVGADLKQKLMESLRSTWNKWKSQPTDGTLERVVEEEIEREPLNDENKQDTAKEKELSTPAMLGRLNAGRRVDYVLQEAPLEMINEYLFAMSSHVGYWESEDTMLLMLREIYSALGIQPDSTVPQQSMSVQRTRMPDTTIIVNSDYPSTSGNAH